MTDCHHLRDLRLTRLWHYRKALSYAKLRLTSGEKYGQMANIHRRHVHTLNLLFPKGDGPAVDDKRFPKKLRLER